MQNIGQAVLDMDTVGMTSMDVEAIVQMNRGSFDVVAQLLAHTSMPMHPEVRLLLAEFMTTGNSRGRLCFKRGRGAPAKSGDKHLSDLIHAKIVVDAERKKGAKSIETAIRNAASSMRPAKSFEALKKDYYEWLNIEKRLKAGGQL